MNLPDIHLLQAAIMLAEVRNYSRAARKLGIQQPTLTKRILELEHLCGFQLFLRSTQFVEPTDACRQFIEEATQCIFHAERAMQVVRLAELGAQRVLHIGKFQHADPYLISILNTVALPLFPGFEVSLRSMSMADLETEVLLGKLDMAISTGDFDDPKLTQLELTRVPFYLAFPQTCNLAQHKELILPQLHKKTWVLFDRQVNPPLHDFILRTAVEQDVRPRAVHYVMTAEEAAQELYAGTGEVAFLNRAAAWRIARNGLTMRPLNSPELFISAKLIARADNSSRIVSEFTRAYKRKLDMPRKVQLALAL